MMRIDSHVYVGPNLYGDSLNEYQILRNMDSNGIEKAALITNKPHNYSLSAGNSNVNRILLTCPDRFYGIARVDPWQKENALAELKKCREEYGFVGLVLHPWEEVFHVAEEIVYPLVDYAVRNKMFVMVEAGYPLVSHPFDVAELAHKFEDGKFIATHGLQMDSAAYALTDAEFVMKECPNIIMETSGMYAPAVVERIIHELGVERVIFGSDSPRLDQKFETDRISRLSLTDSERAMVFGGNFELLLNK